MESSGEHIRSEPKGEMSMILNEMIYHRKSCRSFMGILAVSRCDKMKAPGAISRSLVLYSNIGWS